MKTLLIYVLSFYILPALCFSQSGQSNPSSKTEGNYLARFLPPRLRLFDKINKEAQDRMTKRLEAERDSELISCPECIRSLRDREKLVQGSSQSINTQPSKFGTENPLTSSAISDGNSHGKPSSTLSTGSNYTSLQTGPVQESWRAYYSSNSDSMDDIATAIACDKKGYVYVTGGSESNQDNGFDYVTIKYDSNGTEQWTSRYNGPGNSTDMAVGIAIDSVGNVYVTGSSVGINGNIDYATIKYNSGGIQQWIARYNGTGDSADYASVLALDDSGNVYVTGASWGNNAGYDYATVKYNSAGVEQWVKRYNGPGNGDDEPAAMVIDKQQNVYITGKSWGWGTDYDYATIIYRLDGGTFEGRYNGPADSTDLAVAIALDDSDNVYVTGGSAGVGMSCPPGNDPFRILGKRIRKG